MRIVGGRFGGRTLSVPKSNAIRPTQDRVREALFNMIAAEVPGCAFLDLFAGSGAVGLEALSRGAAAAVFVERDRRHADVLRRNIAALGVDAAAKVVVADAYKWITSYSGPGFSAAFADPPYALGEERGYESVLTVLSGRNIVCEGGLFVAEADAAQQPAAADGWELIRDRAYGKTRIFAWRRISRA